MAQEQLTGEGSATFGSFSVPEVPTRFMDNSLFFTLLFTPLTPSTSRLAGKSWNKEKRVLIPHTFIQFWEGNENIPNMYEGTGDCISLYDTVTAH